MALDGDEAHHLVKVRRVGVGALVELFDGRGTAYRAEVVGLGRDRVELSIVGELLSERAPTCSLTLATAVPKGERFDWLVEKATELGVARLVPLATERSVVEPRPAKLERLRRAVIEASKQCGRSRLMELAPVASWTDYLRDESAPTRLMAHPGGIPARAWPLDTTTPRAALAIGPEGGFNEAEVDAAVAAGWSVVGLGPTLLRVETAALVGCSNVLTLWEHGETPA